MKSSRSKATIMALPMLTAAALLAAQERTDTGAQPPLSVAAEHYAKTARNADPTSVRSIVFGDGSATEATATQPWACASCHGAKGGGAQSVPRLAGLSAGYLIKQLHDYRNGTRHDDSMRYVATTLSEEQMAALGVYYAGLEAPPSASPSLGGDLERGRVLALQGDWSVNLPSCFSCHGALGWGVEEAFPALAGQHPAYIHTQLAAWKNGRRANSPVGLMQSVAAVLSPRDMRAVADYLATLPPAQRRQNEQ